MSDNRANEPTEAQVEAAAKEFEFVWDENIDSFDPEQHDTMSYIKTAMRAALVAAQGAAPALPSSGVDEDALAEVIEQARDRSRKDRDITKESLGQYIARAVAEWLKGQKR